MALARRLARGAALALRLSAMQQQQRMLSPAAAALQVRSPSLAFLPFLLAPSLSSALVGLGCASPYLAAAAPVLPLCSAPSAERD